MLVVVCYDIFSDKRRLRVMKKMEGYGKRVQGSVFECHLDTSRLTRLKEEIVKLIDEKHDRVRYYILCGKDNNDARVEGKGQLTVDQPCIVL